LIQADNIQVFRGFLGPDQGRSKLQRVRRAKGRDEPEVVLDSLVRQFLVMLLEPESGDLAILEDEFCQGVIPCVFER